MSDENKNEDNTKVILTFIWDAGATFENESENCEMQIKETYEGKTWKECCDDCASCWDWDDSELVTGESNVVETYRDLSKIIITQNGNDSEASNEIYDYYTKEEERLRDQNT